MSLNEKAVSELLHELVYTHTFRSYDAKARALELLDNLVEKAEGDRPQDKEE